jgi:OOP family OmpA-OmpF porin
MFKTKIAAAVALACLSSVALAQSKMGADAGWYVGAHVGRSTTDFNGTDFNTAAGVSRTTEEHDTSWKLLLGYNFDQNWALEGFYTNMGDAKVKYSGLQHPTTLLFNQTGEFKLNNDAWGIAVKGTIPVHQQWDIYGRLGWTYNRSKMDASFSVADDWLGTGAVPTTGWSADESRSDVLLGIGVEWKPQKNWGIRLEYENYGEFGNKLDNYSDTGRSDSDMWTLGVVVRF